MRDMSEPCTKCATLVWTSQVVRYSDAHRMYWFVSGICETCQKDG